MKILYITKSEKRVREFKDILKKHKDAIVTIDSLFDLEYDPRLYVGQDIFSKDYENRVIFANGSWQDENAFYNATTGNITYFASNKSYTAEEIKEINNDIRLRISMSNLAIKTNYFANLEKGLDELQADAIVPEE